MKNIKAIETSYKGFRFRSRLEARWAVFFDSLGIQWEYEKDGYVIDGICYMPDFYLPRFETFFEVKPGIITDDAAHKAYMLARAKEFTVIISNDPFSSAISDDFISPLNRWFYVRSSALTAVRQLGDVYFGECPVCHRINITGIYYGDLYPIGTGACECDVLNLYMPDNVVNAYLRARRARFEFGEKG